MLIQEGCGPHQCEAAKGNCHLGINHQENHQGVIRAEIARIRPKTRARNLTLFLQSIQHKKGQSFRTNPTRTPLARLIERTKVSTRETRPRTSIQSWKLTIVRIQKRREIQ